VSEGKAAATGLFGSLRRLLHGSAELVEVRLELLAVELQQEKLRVLDALAWLAVAVLALAIALVLLSVFVVMLVAPQYRLAALGAVGLGHFALAWVALRLARSRRHAGGVPFEASLAELRRDRAALMGGEGEGPR
jgi:uncharacterized membrane protein YqjE